MCTELSPCKAGIDARDLEAATLYFRCLLPGKINALLSQEQ